ncbi:MAG TPA: EAL domain-containing protein [Nannocystaceae bacterium]|nr:EAL domain-containing protein [Nannocystaceae bacterium]
MQRRPRVLIADDEDLVRNALARILERAGFEVATVADGEEAARVAKRERFDAVVADVCMPGQDGVGLLRELRDHDVDLPVILLTGAPALESAIAAVDLGAFTYLVKPVESARVIEVVRKACRLRELAELKREALALQREAALGSSDRLTLQNEFGRAMDSLWMAYQPIVRASDGSSYGYEALLRTREASLPHPGAVIDAARRLGRMNDLGRAVRQAAARPWLAPGERGHLFVNLLATDLDDATLLSAESPLAAIASQVVLEITERTALDEVHDVPRKVGRLRELGYRIAIDDLGAGYSGLTSFAQLEPEVAKLDMSLVQGVAESPTKRRIVRSVRELCSEMGILVVAEGIERAEDHRVLVELGCDLLQGYLFGRPAPFESAPT